MSSADAILVLGIGNVLWADEGFGVRCVEELDRRWELPEHVRLLDGGTQGLYLVPDVTAARRLLVFDAIDFGEPPGTLRVERGDAVPRFCGARKMSLHQTGFQEVLAAAELLGQLPEEVVLVGVQAAELEDYGGSLTPAVAAQLEPALAVALAELERWGVVPRLRSVERESELLAPGLARTRYEAGRPTEQEACRVGDSRFLAGGAVCASGSP